MTDEQDQKATRKVTKSTRFEVLKRDSFKCQYCGATAPETVLHVDHIEPVSRGGSNDLTNLITSCSGCNLGKSDKPLSENAAVQKSRAQLDELQARREQLEMMMEWRKGLRQLQDDHVDGLAKYWGDYVKGWHVNESGRAALAKLAKTYSSDEICIAIDEAARAYLKHDENGKLVEDSVQLSFSKIGGICRTNRMAEKEPDIKQLFYIRGILRNRIPGYFNDYKALDILKAARTWDISLDELGFIARTVRNWSGFTGAIGDAIDKQRKALGEDDA